MPVVMNSPSVIFLLSVLLLLMRYIKNRKRLPPGVIPLPGPRGIPFIGRIHDVPGTATWLKFWEWSKVYGPIYQMEMFGSVHVWISSEQIANDLLSKRGAIYSDRPIIPNLPDNRTSGNYTALLGRTETWKRQRKIGAQLMTRAAHAQNYSHPRIELKRLLYQMSRSPQNYIHHIEEYTSRSISGIAWGDPDRAAELRVGTFGLLTTISPSGSVPNVISPLANLPEKYSPWKKAEKKRHTREKGFFEDSFRSVKNKWMTGEAGESLMKTFLDDHSSYRSEKQDGTVNGATDEEGSYIVGMAAIAGALTIGSPIQSFILAMCCYPWWQVRLREEIERVCGGRCPEWEDRSELPVLRAVVKEVIRWRPPVPTGIPHALEKDDVYNGYHIPAGATIHALEWGITRDPITYPDPSTFRPERYLSPSFPTTYKTPLSIYPKLKGHSQFGFGRRTCIGIDLVEQELFLAMGGLVWGFEFKGGKGMGGEGEEGGVGYTSLLISKPGSFGFECALVNGKANLVEGGWREVNGGKLEVKGEELLGLDLVKGGEQINVGSGRRISV